MQALPYGNDCKRVLVRIAGHERACDRLPRSNHTYIINLHDDSSTEVVDEVIRELIVYISDKSPSNVLLLAPKKWLRFFLDILYNTNYILEYQIDGKLKRFLS